MTSHPQPQSPDGEPTAASSSATTLEASSPALQVQGAVKNYGPVRALDELSLRVDGGIFGLLGSNGAGKSTLFRAIVHLLQLDQGEILVRGLRVDHASLEVRRKLTYLPEEPVLEERLTGAELLALVAGLRQLDNRDERQELIADFDLQQLQHRLLGQCSLGQRKRFALAAALMGQPQLVLLDEPLNGLDTANMRRLRLRIEAMAMQGTTFLLSSHVMAFIQRICPRVAILRQGRVAGQGSPEQLAEEAGMAGAPFEDVFLHWAGLVRAPDSEQTA